MDTSRNGADQLGLRIAAELAAQDSKQAARHPSWRHLELAARLRHASAEAESEPEAGS
jgi:hypothetical protein